MKVKLPKTSKGYGFDELCRFEMNNFDIEEVLPPLFYLVVTRGRSRAFSQNDPRDIQGYVDRLSEHKSLSGFDNARGRDLLNRWVRASLIETSRQGRARYGEQIAHIVPLSLLSYKAGFPKQNTRLRKVHTFWYEALRKLLEDIGAVPSAGSVLEKMFREVFGKGVAAAKPPRYDAGFDGTRGLDLSTLLSLYFLDGFSPSEVAALKKGEPIVNRGPALPATLSTMAKSVLSYLTAYAGRLPVAAVSRGLMALMNFYLMIYSLKLIYAANTLLTSKHHPSGGWNPETNLPEIYVDFTRLHRGDSDALARWCVIRDLEEFRAYFKTAVTLRTIDRFATQSVKLRSLLFQIGDAPSYLSALSNLRSDPAIEARSEAERELIYEESTKNLNQSEREDFDRWLEEEERLSTGALDVVIRLLVAAQGKNGVENCMKWFGNIGGMKKSYGLLSGTRRNSTRYAMTDDLLAALVQAAMTDFADNTAQASPLPRLRLSEFITYLRENFGILIDRPPALMDSARARAAAADNLEAFKRRLRQMGYFQALSDDFTAQYLKANLVEEIA